MELARETRYKGAGKAPFLYMRLHAMRRQKMSYKKHARKFNRARSRTKRINTAFFSRGGISL